MKKILFIVIIIFATSCDYKNTEDVRKITSGISTNELKYIMGDPEDVEIQPGYENWTFYYDGGGNRLNGLVVTIKSDKVVSFYSY